MYDILGLRVTLELGMVDEIFSHINDKHMKSSPDSKCKSTVLENNLYERISEISFTPNCMKLPGTRRLLCSRI